MTDFKELIAPFRNYFQLLIADTPELREKVYRIRYDVFCREFGFESDRDGQEGLERDAFDEQAIHCLVMHQRTNLAAGCVRLVRTLPHDPISSLPIELQNLDSLIAAEGLPPTQPKDRLIEISRLAVAARFRKRRGESESPIGVSPEIASEEDEIEQRVFPLLSFTILLAALSLSFKQRCDNVAMMEPWLVRHLKLMGFAFRQIGPVIPDHGMRAACYYPFDQALMDRERHVMLRRLLEDLIDPWVESEARRTGLVHR